MDRPCYCSNKDLFNFGCQCKGQKPLYLWSNNDEEWWVAESAEEACELAVKSCGCLPGEGGAVEDWTKVPDNKIIHVLDEDGNKVHKTAKEWAASEGKGFLCGQYW